MTRRLLMTLLAGLCAIAGTARASAEKPPGLTPPKTGKIAVAVVLTDGATVIDFAGPWEVFEDVMVEGRGSSHDDMMPFDLYTVGDRKAPVVLSGGLTVVPQFTFDDAPAPRAVVVGAQRGSPKMIEWLQKVAADPRTDVVMSVCTGAFKLAKAGLLDGKPATTHHGFYDEFAREFPKVRLKRGLRFVRSDRHIFTAGGLTSGIDLALHIVELYFGQSVAQQTATDMEYQGTGWRNPAATPAAP
jgi:transcriptional regulator GlxA family with amidase domain